MLFAFKAYNSAKGLSTSNKYSTYWQEVSFFVHTLREDEAFLQSKQKYEHGNRERERQRWTNEVMRNVHDSNSLETQVYVCNVGCERWALHNEE